MVEPTTAPDSDELRLAQLACLKLARLAQGALSVGLPALVTRVPEPRAFLLDRFRVLAAFALVLQAANWPAGDVAAVLRLRERAREMLRLLEDLQQQLLAALDSPGPVHARLGPARDTVLAFFGSAETYAALVRLADAPVRKARAVVLETFDAMDTLAPSPASAG